MPTFDSDLAALKYLRDSNGWTQDELGKKIGVTGPQISRYENGADKVNCARNEKLKMLFKDHHIKIVRVKASKTDSLILMDLYQSFDKTEKKIVANFMFDLKNKVTDDKRKQCLEQLN